MERSYMERKWMTLDGNTEVKQKWRARRRYTPEETVMQIKKIGSHLPINFILIVKFLKPKRRQLGKEGERQEEMLLLLGRVVCRSNTLGLLFGHLTRHEGWSIEYHLHPPGSGPVSRTKDIMMTKGTSTTHLASLFYFFKPLIPSEAVLVKLET